MDVYPDNTMASFRTKIPATLELGLGEWEVGMSEIIFPTRWNNVTGDLGIVIRTVNYDDSNIDTSIVTVPQGYYDSCQRLIDAAHRALSASGISDVEFLMDADSKKVFLALDTPILEVTLGKDLACELGFSSVYRNFCGVLELSDKIIEALPSPFPAEIVKVDEVTVAPLSDYGLSPKWTEETRPEKKGLSRVIHVSPHPSRLNIHEVFFVYCDLVRARPVGDAVVPLLRAVVPARDKELDVQSFYPVHYLPVNRSSFDTVEVNIRHSHGDLVAFQSGRVIVTLHFRRAP